MTKCIQMLSVLLLLSLSAPALAFKGSSAWFYSLEDCKPVTTRANPVENKDHQKWSMELGIERGTCWKHENGQDKNGARRKSVWIDPPKNKDDTELIGCLQMWTDTTCDKATPVNQVSFTQSRDWPICVTFDDRDDPYELGYSSYEFFKGDCVGSTGHVSSFEIKDIQ